MTLRLFIDDQPAETEQLGLEIPQPPETKAVVT